MNIRVPPISHATLVQLAEAGSIDGTQVVGQAGGWAVVVSYGANERILSAQRSQSARVFKKLDTLVSYLKEIGITKFDVDTIGFDAHAGVQRTRPDRADTLRAAHEAASHDLWFREQVRRALSDADSGTAEWVTHDAAALGWAEKRKALEAKAGGAKA